MSNLFPSLGMLFTNLILLKPELYLYYLCQALKKHPLPIIDLKLYSSYMFVSFLLCKGSNNPRFRL